MSQYPARRRLTATFTLLGEEAWNRPFDGVLDLLEELEDFGLIEEIDVTEVPEQEEE